MAESNREPDEVIPHGSIWGIHLFNRSLPDFLIITTVYSAIDYGPKESERYL
jgi:hypothetical protein